jgi:hypothetical protein
MEQQILQAIQQKLGECLVYQMVASQPDFRLAGHGRFLSFSRVNELDC